jgi:hypothetical protein
MRAILAASAVFAASTIGAVPASAAIVETVTVRNTYSYGLTGGASVPSAEGPDRQTVFIGQRSPAPESDLGVDYVGEADSNTGSFFFLHNNYCVGSCNTSSSTVITFTVTNTGSEAVALRFDSLITPGHVARVDSDAAGRGSFAFTVTQRTAGQQDISLYSAFGLVNGETVVASGPGDESFNNQSWYEVDGGRGTDWDATPLNLELGALAAGATTQVIYSANYLTSSGDNCTDVSRCGGLQVVFGDPRNNGSVTALARGFGAFADPDPVTLINREYDAYSVPYAFNLSGSEYPDLPPGQGPINYSGTYAPLSISAVPEPATWLSMILGLLLAGGMLRRRLPRRRDLVAA